jgi:hypothetical protein
VEVGCWSDDFGVCLGFWRGGVYVYCWPWRALQDVVMIVYDMNECEVR